MVEQNIVHLNADPGPEIGIDRLVQNNVRVEHPAEPFTQTVPARVVEPVGRVHPGPFAPKEAVRLVPAGPNDRREVPEAVLVDEELTETPNERTDRIVRLRFGQQAIQHLVTPFRGHLRVREDPGNCRIKGLPQGLQGLDGLLEDVPLVGQVTEGLRVAGGDG